MPSSLAVEWLNCQAQILIVKTCRRWGLILRFSLLIRMPREGRAIAQGDQSSVLWDEFAQDVFIPCKA